MEMSYKKEKELRISYELLFEILRREKNREDLQQLEPDFFGSVFDYLNTLYAELRQMHEDSSTDPQLDDEIEKIQLKIQNLKKMVRDLYGRREKKIVGLAVMRSRTQQSIVDTSLLLENEKRLFEALTALLETHKVEQLGVLAGNGSTPAFAPPSSVANKLPLNMSAGVEPSIEAHKSISAALEAPQVPEPVLGGVSNSPQDTQHAVSSASSLVPVRFLSVVQKFVGPSLEIYGPYQEGDTAELPAVVASILIEKQKAQRREEAERREMQGLPHPEPEHHPEPHHGENEQDERVIA